VGNSRTIYVRIRLPEVDFARTVVSDRAIPADQRVVIVIPRSGERYSDTIEGVGVAQSLEFYASDDIGGGRTVRYLSGNREAATSKGHLGFQRHCLRSRIKLDQEVEAQVEEAAKADVLKQDA